MAPEVTLTITSFLLHSQDVNLLNLASVAAVVDVVNTELKLQFALFEAFAVAVVPAPAVVAVAVGVAVVVSGTGVLVVFDSVANDDSVKGSTKSKRQNDFERVIN